MLNLSLFLDLKTSLGPDPVFSRTQSQMHRSSHPSSETRDHSASLEIAPNHAFFSFLYWGIGVNMIPDLTRTQ